MTPLHYREELRVEDGTWVSCPGPDELMVVLVSGPVVSGLPSTAEFVSSVLGQRSLCAETSEFLGVDANALRDPEQVLEALHRRASDERLLSAVAAFWRKDKLEIAWIGEARGHLIRSDRLAASTRDHTLANEFALKGQAEANPGLARICTRTLGGPGARPDTQSWSRRPGDTVLLCATHLHDFRPPAQYLDDALDFTRSLPGRLLVEDFL